MFVVGALVVAASVVAQVGASPYQHTSPLNALVTTQARMSPPNRYNSTRRLQEFTLMSVGATPSSGIFFQPARCVKAGQPERSYPEPVPFGIAVPHWAYYDFTGTGVFNTAVAQQQSGPESSTPATATFTSTFSSASGATTRHIETPSATSNSSRSSSSNNTGAIVGGVVGGIIGLALLGLVAFLAAHKSEKSSSNDAQYVQGDYNPSAAPQNPGIPLMSRYQSGMHHPSLMSPAGMESKPYDPSHSIVFPVPHLNNTPSQHSQSLDYSRSPSQYRPGHYNGVPEV
ncbi:transmembrane protein [Ceratobasidium sp. AG-Ba]|nr:transmembrane protein [Ceratobasidium sp. AG-Ba]